MPEVETLDTAASEEALEQPAPEQADSEVSEQVQDDAPAAEATETVDTPEPAPRKYADKYDKVEELERAYRETSAEASRMAQRLAQLERGQPKETPKEKGPSVDQLESWKEVRIREVSKFDLAADRLRAEGRYQEADQMDARAAESARQVRLIDAELRKHDIQSTLRQNTSKDAEARLIQEASTVLRNHASDLVPGTKLYAKASEYLSGYEAMGMDISNALVQAQAVSMAVQVLGLSSTKVEQKTRKELTKTISQAMKTAVATGAGKASTKAGSYPDFLNMTEDEFISWKAKRGLGH